MSKYKICFVPTCPNTRNNSPEKTFVYVSDNLKSRWCMENNFEYIPKHCFCCEDHLDLKEDLTNYRIWKQTNAKPLLKSSANLLLNRRPSEILHSEKSSLLDPLRLIYIKKCDSIKKLKPFKESPVKSGNTVNVSSQSKVQTVDRSTHKAQKARSSKPPHGLPIRPHRLLAENPESTILPPSKSKQTFIISPLTSHNAVSIDIQCKAETEDCGTTSENICEQSDRPTASANNADASLQCTLLSADGNSMKPRKPRFSKSFIKRYDLVQDNRKIIPSSSQMKSTYKKTLNNLRSGESTSLIDNENTSGTLKSRYARPTAKTDDLPQDQGKTRTPNNTDSVSLQSGLPLRIPDSTCEAETPIETKPRASEATQKNPITRNNMPRYPGTQLRIRRPSENTAHVSLQVGSRNSSVRSSIASKEKGMLLSPTSLDRGKVSGHRDVSKQIVIRIPKSSNNYSSILGKQFIHSRETEEI